MGVMDDAHALPDDLAACQRLLLAAFQQASELERVLEETAVSYQELKETHQAALEELSALKRWIYGQRRERLLEGAGQQHLFELEPSSEAVSPPESPRETRSTGPRKLARPATPRAGDWSTR